MLSSSLLTTSYFIVALTKPCILCWSPYFPVIVYAVGSALISPSVNSSIPLITGKEHLAFAFSIYRAFGAISTGVWIMVVGIVQEKTVNLMGGYYWVSFIEKVSV